MDTESKPIAQLDWSLRVECPNCNESLDAAGIDAGNDYTITKMVFSNRWDDITGCSITCPECGHEFELGGMEY